MDPVAAMSGLAAAAFDAIPLGAAIFRSGNGTGLEFQGSNAELREAIGDELSIYFADEARGDFCEVVRNSLVSMEPRTVVLPVGSHERTFQLSSRSFTGPDRLEYAVVQFRPITGQESRENELRSTIQQLQDLVDNSTALMYIKDLDGRYLIVNDYFARLFGVDARSIVGLTDHDLFPDSSADVYSVHDQMVLTTGKPVEVEEPFAAIGGATDPDDDRRWLSIKFPLLDNFGQPYALGAISTDITDRKRAESAAREAMHEAERANQSKNEFLSRMSHELRTPLNAIIGFAQLLADLPLGATANESAGHIFDAGKHLLGLVNDVLDITWIEAGAPGIALSVIPAVEPIYHALEIIRPLAAAADIEVASDLHGALHRYVMADARRLRQVFLNLLGNAVKFNRSQGAIRVWCQAEDDRLRFLITDTGLGIDDDDVPRLFAPFVRLASAEAVEGTGLGLALSHRLVAEMGGSMGIQHTAPGEGSTFFVEIPLADAPGEPEPSGDEIVQKDLPLVSMDAEATILYIEDTYANLRLVENIVAGMGKLKLVSATSGKAGIKLAAEIVPQLVLLDLNLADMSGVDVVKRLHEDESTRDIPIIVLSADATPARIAQLRKLGIEDYLTKPLDIHHFARTVREALVIP